MNIKKLFLTMPIAAAICLYASVCTAFAEDGIPIEDDIIAEEEVPITDGIRRGEGYYECVVVYRDGKDSIYDEDGNACSLISGMSGNLKDGAARETVEREMIESVKVQYDEIGKAPDESAFDVYVYFYDDYDLSPQEFLDFVAEDSSSRGENSVSANPSTGTDAPFAAAASVLLSVACITLVRTRKARD